MEDEAREVGEGAEGMVVGVQNRSYMALQASRTSWLLP